MRKRLSGNLRVPTKSSLSPQLWKFQSHSPQSIAGYERTFRLFPTKTSFFAATSELSMQITLSMTKRDISRSFVEMESFFPPRTTLPTRDMNALQAGQRSAQGLWGPSQV